MNEPVDHPVWSDERVESLLREFFRNEMPAELRELRDAPATPSSRDQTRPGRRAGLAGLVTAATAVAAVWIGLALQSPIGHERRGNRPNSNSRAAVVEDSEESAVPLDQLERPGVRQPVELRSRGGIEHVGAAPGLEIEYPEWEADIRIYGTEEQQKAKPADPN